MAKEVADSSVTPRVGRTLPEFLVHQIIPQQSNLVGSFLNSAKAVYEDYVPLLLDTGARIELVEDPYREWVEKVLMQGHVTPNKISQVPNPKRSYKYVPLVPTFLYFGSLTYLLQRAAKHPES